MAGAFPRLRSVLGREICYSAPIPPALHASSVWEDFVKFQPLGVLSPLLQWSARYEVAQHGRELRVFATAGLNSGEFAPGGISLYETSPTDAQIQSCGGDLERFAAAFAAAKAALVSDAPALHDGTCLVGCGFHGSPLCSMHAQEDPAKHEGAYQARKRGELERFIKAAEELEALPLPRTLRLEFEDRGEDPSVPSQRVNVRGCVVKFTRAPIIS